MALTPGTRLGVYDVTAPIGEGGMGQVYRARDTKLNRDVALKVLPDSFANDADRLARFTREAQTLASLNHPHIAGIYGLEESGGVRALVMELVEGEDLSQRIARGAIPIDDALPIARQIAEALEVAHAQGIIHRDLKPANIKVRPDGTVKVLDFGLAKLVAAGSGEGGESGRSEAGLANSPTLTTPAHLRQGYGGQAQMTGAGMILGTAAYMAPEQAKGRVADKGSDVWAFGCVLYEMLTGKRAFEGEDISDTLAAVLRGDPDWTAIPADVPVSVRALVQGCVRKDRKQRIGDVSTVLFLLNEPASVSAVTTATVTPSRPLWKRASSFAATALIAGAVVGATMWTLRLSPAVPPVARYQFALGEGQQFTNVGRHVVAISPDGTQMVYVANQRLYLRLVSELEARPIAGTEVTQGIQDTAFSPDGRSIAFRSVADSTLKRVAVSGGAAVTICPADNVFGIHWSPDGIVFGQGSKGILRVFANGGKPEQLVSVKGDELADSPQMLPGGQAVLFTLATGASWDKARIVVQSLKTGERKTVIEGGSDGRYLPTGHVVYALGGVLYAVPFDLKQLSVMSGPVPIVEGVRRAGNNTGAAQFSVSNTGSLMFVPGPVAASSVALELGLIDRAGLLQPLKTPPGPYEFPRVSPDGKQITFGTDDGKEAIVWIYDLAETSSMKRLTFGGRNRFPIWSSDGQRVAFQSDREGDPGIFWQRADGTGPVERLTKADQGASHIPQTWSPDGERFLFRVTSGTKNTLWTFSVRDKKATRFGDIESTVPIGAGFSPDGRWVAYDNRETSANARTVFVQPFPPTGARYQLSNTDGLEYRHALWSADGKKLFFVIGGTVQGRVVAVTTTPTFAFGIPQPVPLGGRRDTGSDLGRHWDVMPDGTRFLGIFEAGQSETTTATTPQIRVVLNWFEELRAKVPGAR